MTQAQPGLHSETLSQNFFHSRALAVHICNPTYSEGREQEDGGLKPALGK
jgi:hypothetical protein